MNLPTSGHPGTVIFVDDDANYLTVIKNVFESKWNVKTFSSASEFVKHMKSVKHIQDDINAYHRGAIDRYKRGGSVAMEAMRFWNAFPQRFSMPLVVVIDYHMPDLNGMEALKQVEGWGGKKILLTGVADELMVCKAFNDRTIDYYIPKQTALIMQAIESSVNQMLDCASTGSETNWDVWTMSMKPEQRLILQSPEVFEKLRGTIGCSNEYICLGDPFGVLMLSYDGDVKWLQLETASSLDSAANMALDLGGNGDEALNVRAGRCMTDARLRSSLRMTGKPEYAPIEFSVQIPGISEVLYGATFEVKSVGAPLAQSCYNTWKSTQIDS